MKKSILITGGTGFIGYHLAKRCIKMNWKVTSLSSKLPKKIRKLKKVKYLICDLTKKKSLDKKINDKFNYVVNLSGQVDHKNRKKTFNSHYKAVKNLSNKFHNSDLDIFIQMGSSAEYGGLSRPQKENEKCYPKSYYGFAKLYATKYLIDLYRNKKFPVVILRLYQAYGPSQDINRLIPIVINSCKKNLSFNCSDGNQLRDFIYIDDVIDALIKCIKNKKAKGQIFNIGSGFPIKIKKIISDISYYYKGGTPLYGRIKLRKDESHKIYANNNKIKKLLNWKPKIIFKTGLLRTLKYYDKKR